MEGCYVAMAVLTKHYFELFETVRVKFNFNVGYVIGL
jgi:hypothetical protein